MKISVRFDGQNWSTDPYVASVRRGTPIEWAFESPGLPSQNVQWTAYFDHGSPFRLPLPEFSISTTASPPLVHSGTSARPLLQHSGVTSAVYADDPGDYKYGVRATDLERHSLLGDDDPYLRVSPE